MVLACLCFRPSTKDDDGPAGVRAPGDAAQVSICFAHCARQAPRGRAMGVGLLESEGQSTPGAHDARGAGAAEVQLGMQQGSQ